MAPIIGQNWGAGRFDRVRETVREALIFSVVWSCFVAVVLASLAHSIADIFSDDIDLKIIWCCFFLLCPYLILWEI
jgi:Na+-driven multidrug efflux pump